MKEVLVMIKPDKEEVKRVNSITKEFLSKLNSKLKGAKAILGGSGAKGTWLSGNHDVDIFVKYDKNVSSDRLEKVLKIFKNVSRVHGSRDYFQLQYEGIEFEVVPILKISKAADALNITDISPLHAKWVNKHVKKKDEVLLAKQFFKAQGLYGAESYIGGFSGYVLEILIAKFGTFEKLLKSCLKWKAKEIFDLNNFYKGKDVLFELNQSKLSSPIVVIDPVDRSRNAAAALTMDKFSILKINAKKYLKKPSEDYFIKKEVTLESLPKKNLVFVKVVPLEGKRDVVGMKLLKAFGHIEKKLSPFEVVKSGWSFDFFWFNVKKDELDLFEIRKGPPVKMKEFVKDFKKKNKNNYVSSGHVMAKVKRKYPKLDDFVKDVFKDEYVKERVKKVSFP